MIRPIYTCRREFAAGGGKKFRAGCAADRWRCGGRNADANSFQADLVSNHHAGQGVPDAVSENHPPKPQFALAIGIVGHKPNRLAKDEETLKAAEAAIHAKVDEVFAAIAQTAKSVRSRYGDYFSGDSVLSVVSALAEGADTIAAQAALDRKEKDFVLDAPLPFAIAVYEDDFKTDGAKVDYRQLLDRARSVLALPGERKGPTDTDAEGKRKESRSYEAVGLTVLSQSDILLAIWDGGESRGRGGTTDILNAAARSGTPVIHIDIDGKTANLRWGGLDDYPVSVTLLQDLRPAPLDGAILDRLVDRLVRPPILPTERAALNKYFEEQPKVFNLRFEFPLLLTAFCIKGIHYGDVRPDGPDKLAAELASFIAPARGDIGIIAYAYGRADAIGVRFGQRFRSAFVLNFVLAAVAVVLAVVSLHFHDFKPWFVFIEIILIASVMTNTRIGQEGRWHRRWVEARELAERLRAAALLWVLGARPANLTSVEPTWTGWYARSVLRAQGMRPGSLDQEGLEIARRVMSRLLRDQCRYHVRTVRRMHRLERRLEKFGLWLFQLTFWVAVVFVLGALVMMIFKIQFLHDWDMFVAYTVTILAAGLPALATASYGIRVIGDFDGMARRSRRTRAALRRVITATHYDPPDIAVLRARANEASEAMLGDVSSWRLSAESRGLAIPG